MPMNVRKVWFLQALQIALYFANITTLTIFQIILPVVNKYFINFKINSITL
jgi:hypothetical protein